MRFAFYYSRLALTCFLLHVENMTIFLSVCMFHIQFFFRVILFFKLYLVVDSPSCRVSARMGEKWDTTHFLLHTTSEALKRTVEQTNITPKKLNKKNINF